MSASRRAHRAARRAGEIADLDGIGGLLLWDQNTMMPPGGADARADQFEALERIQHDRITDPALGKLLDALEPWAASADPDSDDVALDRVLRRDHHKAVSVPTDLAAEISSAAAHAQQAWMEAREKADFKPLRSPRSSACWSSSTATSRASTARASSRTRTTSCSTTTSRA